MSNAVHRGLDDSSEETDDDCGCFGLITICLLGICGVLGTSVGLYLVMTEDVFPNDHVFSMVPNIKWNLKQSPPYLKLPATKIFITNTNTNKCFILDNCAQNVTKGQEEIFNFLVDRDGVIFEGLGWHHPCRQSAYCDDSSISVAFMGELVDNCPKKGTIRSVINFIKSSQTNSKINKCFRTTVDVIDNQSTKLCLLQVAAQVQEVTKKYGC